MRIDIRDSKYSIIYNEKTGAVEDVLWCNESAEDLKNLNIVADMARELAVYRRAGVAMFAGAKAIRDLIERGMTMLGSTRATPRIRSYLYCDAVDACFYYAGAVPSVVVTARWTADSPDIAEGSKKLQIAAEVVRRMMTAMDKAMKAEKDRQWAAYMEEQKLK